VVFVEDGPVIGTVAENADAGHFAPRVVMNGRARAEKPLHRVRFNGRRAKPHEGAFCSVDVFGFDQAQAAQSACGLPRREVQRAMTGHLLAVHRMHRHFIRSRAPEVRHLSRSRNGDKSAMRRSQDVGSHDGIGVETHLGSTQGAKAQIEHLQRQPVSLGLIVLTDVPASFEQTKKPMNRRRRLADGPGQLGEAHPTRSATQDFADLKGFVDRRYGRASALARSWTLFHRAEYRFKD